MIISIIICTYNRANILKLTLPPVLTLEIPKGVKLELIIIDNNSKDNTARLSKKFVENNISPIEMYYFFEKEQGLSYARNTGYKNAKGGYIVYIDDECILPKQWLVEAIKIINIFSPAFLGGPYYGKYLPGSSSSWYKESYGDSYILQYNLPNGPMVNRYLSGGNFFVRRDIFEEIGLFDVELGMSGETINYGEEIDFQKRFIQAHPQEVIWYDEKVFLYHCIRNEKMKISFLFNDALIRGASSAELGELKKTQLKKVPFHLIYFIFKALVSFISKLSKSIFGKEKLFRLLYSDYEDGTWRNIGSAWFKVKQLAANLFS